VIALVIKGLELTMGISILMEAQLKRQACRLLEALGARLEHFPGFVELPETSPIVNIEHILF
jgi:hypothetical protein